MNGAIDRRGFLGRALAAPLAAAASSTLIGAGPGVAPIARTGGPKLKTSLNAFSFNKTLNDQIKGRAKGTSLLDLLNFCAEAGFDAIDPTGYYFPGYPAAPPAKYVNDFKRRAFQLGIEISGTGVRNNFAAPEKERRAADVRHVQEWVEVAARLGTPVLRVFAGPVLADRPWDEVAAWMADDLRTCAEHGAKFGVLIGVQNHGDMLKNADQVLKLLRLVDSDWLGAIVDTGFFPTPDPYDDIARVAPYAVNWQVKEKLDGAAGTAKIDLKRLVTIIEDARYRGYVPIEILAAKDEPDFNPAARARALLAELRAVIDHEG